jgi:hypothetical protein
MVWPAAGDQLIYSSMMTPICRETPDSASIPTLDETLVLVCVS